MLTESDLHIPAEHLHGLVESPCVESVPSGTIGYIAVLVKDPGGRLYVNPYTAVSPSRSSFYDLHIKRVRSGVLVDTASPVTIISSAEIRDFSLYLPVVGTFGGPSSGGNNQ